jgi:hypothetical protein
VSAVGDVVAWFADPEHWSGPSGVPTRVVEHLGLTAAALGIACAIAVPLALWLGHLGRGGPLAVNLANVGRAVPTFAVLVLLAIGPLASGPRRRSPRWCCSRSRRSSPTATSGCGRSTATSSRLRGASG